ncbi:Bifunctional nitrilase/nitrile hydratase NIT4 [Linum grandiflorum]
MEDISVLSVTVPKPTATMPNSKVQTSRAGEVPVRKPTPPMKTYTRRGRGRPPTGTMNLRPPRRRISVPTSSYRLLVQLKQKHRLSSFADTVHWLLHRIRPDLIPLGPSPKRPDPGPICMPLGSRVGVAPVRATVVQATSLFFNTPATLDKAEKLTAIAAAYGSHLVVFPEAFVGGYPWCMSSNSAPTDLEMMVKYCSSAITLPGPEFERLQKIASKNRVYLVMGVVERCQNFLFSTIVFLDPLGRLLGRQRKLIPRPSETGIWCSGRKSSSFPLFQTLVGSIGGLISWDNKLPLLRNELYAKGIEIYCAPTVDSREQWKSTAVHIAVEGNCFVLSANQFRQRNDYPLLHGDGDANESISSGGSFIASPSGKLLSGPNHEGECLISADLDLEEINRAKRQHISQQQVSSAADMLVKLKQSPQG